jgi:hypothetical protein
MQPNSDRTTDHGGMMAWFNGYGINDREPAPSSSPFSAARIVR